MVRNQFIKLNIRKASGPDGLDGIVLKQCCDQLCGVFSRHQLSFDQHIIPEIWKTSKIIPVQKKTKSSVLNDFRPVALMSHINVADDWKCAEWLNQYYSRFDIFDFTEQRNSHRQHHTPKMMSS